MSERASGWKWFAVVWGRGAAATSVVVLRGLDWRCRLSTLGGLIIISSCRPALMDGCATRPSGAVPNTSKKNVGWNEMILLCGGSLEEHSKHGELRCNLPTHWPGWSWNSFAPFPAARLDPSVSHLYFELGTAKKRFKLPHKLDREREPESDKAPSKTSTSDVL